MFNFIALFAGFIWIQQHPALTAAIAIGIIAFIAWLIRRRKAYLALPIIFLGNKTTRTYHTRSCTQLKQISPLNLVAFRQPKELRGYKPCSLCKPHL